jgi:hypothetical protein
MNSLIPALLGILAFPLFSEAIDDTYFQKQVGILIEYYEVDHTTSLKLLREYQQQDNANGLLKSMQGTATLRDSTYVITTNGQGVKIESIRETIFPTEYDPPELPQVLTGPIEGNINLITPVNPTAYEMRPVGLSVELDPTIRKDGTGIELRFAPEIVEFHGTTEWGKDEGLSKQPLFHSMKTNTNINLDFGTTELFGTYTPASAHDKNGDGNLVFGFITPIRLITAKEGEYSGFEEDQEKWVKENIIDNISLDEPDPEKKSSERISLFVEYIEVDATLAGQIARQITPTIDATNIRRQLDDAIEKGDVKVLESSAMIAKSSQRMKSESIREFIYPTEYDPAEIPQTLTGPIAENVRIATSVNATAYEMRPTGITVEVEPILDGKNLKLNIASEIVRLAAMLTHGEGLAAAQQPMFESIKISTAITIPSDATVLLGIHSLESARAGEAATEEEQNAVKNRRILVFVTSKVKGLTAAPEK